MIFCLVIYSRYFVSYFSSLARLSRKSNMQDNMIYFTIKKRIHKIRYKLIKKDIRLIHSLSCIFFHVFCFFHITMHITKRYKKQISLTEWFENIDHEDAQEMRKEDNDKRDRMGFMNTIIDFPNDQPTKFPALDVFNRSDNFKEFLNDRGNELCGLRLIPTDSRLPKLRMRGFAIKDVINGWFTEQKIDHSKYIASFIPHPRDHNWGTIFVVNRNGIFGEIINESHEKLTQGFYEKIKPINFSFDFKTWKLSEENQEALAELKRIVSYLHITNIEKQNELIERVNSSFANDYICGYFETVTTEEFGMTFIDYNRILGKIYSDYEINLDKADNDYILKGQIGSPGLAEGRVKIISEKEIPNTNLEKDEILVCDMTTPSYVPLMKQAAAILTNRGGILTHAAIISRELKKPCIVGTGNSTQILKNGDLIEVDATNGIVRRI